MKSGVVGGFAMKESESGQMIGVAILLIAKDLAHPTLGYCAGKSLVILKAKAASQVARAN